jgi:hypothetical protein
MGRLLNEPVVITSLIQSGIALGIAFGLTVTPEQLAAIMAFTGTVLAFLARALVTPNQLAEARVAEGLSPTQPRDAAGGPPRMPAILLAAALSLGALGLPACSNNAPPATEPTANLTPSGRAAYQATRVVKALDVLRDIAISAEEQSPKLMSTNSTRKVILYHQAIVKTIRAVPDGWVAVAQEGLDNLRKEIPADEWKQIDPYVRLVLAIYQEVRP